MGKLSLNKDGLVAVARTVAALLIGNSVIIPVVTEGKNPYWLVLFIIGMIVFCFVGLQWKESKK